MPISFWVVGWDHLGQNTPETEPPSWDSLCQASRRPSRPPNSQQISCLTSMALNLHLMSNACCLWCVLASELIILISNCLSFSPGNECTIVFMSLFFEVIVKIVHRRKTYFIKPFTIHPVTAWSNYGLTYILFGLSYKGTGMLNEFKKACVLIRNKNVFIFGLWFPPSIELCSELVLLHLYIPWTFLVSAVIHL